MLRSQFLGTGKYRASSTNCHNADSCGLSTGWVASCLLSEVMIQPSVTQWMYPSLRITGNSTSSVSSSIAQR